jgi:hypothetical protein
MSDLHIDISEMLSKGIAYSDVVDAVKLEYGMSQDEAENLVYGVECQLMDESIEDGRFEDDGDALASAGWGTDEDYGHYGDDYE